MLEISIMLFDTTAFGIAAFFKKTSFYHSYTSPKNVQLAVKKSYTFSYVEQKFEEIH